MHACHNAQVAILQRARAFRADGLHANGYAVDKSLRTARLRTHGARVTMLDEEEDIDAPTEEDRAAQMSNIDDPGPDITLGVPVHNTHYCFEDRAGGEIDGGYGDGCSTETMATADGARISRRDTGQGHVLVQKRANRRGSATTKKLCAAHLLYAAYAYSISAGLQAEKCGVCQGGCAAARGRSK